MTEEQVFLAALELADPAERNAYLVEACGKDVEFRHRVEELLAAHFKSGAFLDQPIGEQLGAGESSSSDNTVDMRTHLRGDAATDRKKPDQEPDDLHFLQPSSRPDSLGRIGHYEVLEILGKGGFGIVMRAFDETLQRVVALKVLAPAIAATSPARKRFLREARSSARVRHEHVVQVHAVGEEPLPYLVMEFIPGETLQKRLDRIGPLETPEIVRIGRQIAEGLAAAHANDLIHRDIKPGNVLLEGGQLRVKITDFGLARAADDASLTQSGVLSGTPMYMAPEQAKGESIDHRADLFSLGSVMYVMATGRPPFRASTTFGVLKRVAEETPRPIREVIPEVPVWLCDIIGKLQAKKPEDRFQSAREVADILADCEAKLKGEAKTKDFYRIPQSKPAARKPGKWKWIAAAVLLLPIIALAVTEITGVTHLFRDQTPNPGPGPIAKGDPSKKNDDPNKKNDPPDKAATNAAAWERAVAGLPADEQVKAVIARMQHLNPDFDGKVEPTIENGVVTGLRFQTDQVSDISPVHALTKLRSLDCSGSFVDRGKLSARALVPLRGLPLTNLSCNDSLALSDLSSLNEMNLTSLNLRQANVGDADVKNLTGMKELQVLSLWQTKVTDVGLKELAALKNLQRLSLQATAVTDVGLKELAGLARLTALDLYAVPKVTDAGLEELARLKTLKEVDLRGTNVTDGGVDKLAAALPSLRIVTSGRVIEPKVVSRPAWTVLKAVEMKSDGGATLKLEKDLSVLVSGNHPDTDVYTLTFRELPGKIHSLRLEAFTHDSLPNMGPSRHPNVEATFVVSTIKAELVPVKGAPLPLTWSKAWGDDEPAMGHPMFAIDADDNTGWAPENGKPHYAVFELEQAVAVPEGAVLRVTLEFKHSGAQRELGCFRLSAAKEKVNPPSGTDK
ncbi:MAG TPA: protein kinase [Gemmataceae bacterium]|nr:protein kinase [Gemmataceae bacterium]